MMKATATELDVSNRDQFFKIKMCPFFLKGICKKGAQCSFAHHESEIRVGISLRKTRMCQAWKAGLCSDENCKFAHGEGELRCTPDYYKTSICKYWVEGHCPQGDSCRHAHGEHELRKRSYKYTNSEKKQAFEPVSEKEKEKDNKKIITKSYSSCGITLKTPRRRNSCISSISTVSSESTTQNINAPFIAKKSNRPPPPPPGLSRPESTPAPVAEFYDGQIEDYVILPVDVYKTPKACDTNTCISLLEKRNINITQNENTNINNIHTTFSSSISTLVPVSPTASASACVSLSDTDLSFVSTFEGLSISDTKEQSSDNYCDIQTSNSELQTGVSIAYREKNKDIQRESRRHHSFSSTSPSSIFRYPTNLEQSTCFSTCPVDTPSDLDFQTKISDIIQTDTHIDTDIHTYRQNETCHHKTSLPQSMSMAMPQSVNPNLNIDLFGSGPFSAQTNYGKLYNPHYFNSNQLELNTQTNTHIPHSSHQKNVFDDELQFHSNPLQHTDDIIANIANALFSIMN